MNLRRLVQHIASYSLVLSDTDMKKYLTLGAPTDSMDGRADEVALYK